MSFERGSRALWSFAVFAAAVALEGKALLLPGEAGSGRSTLVEALLAEGAEPLSEDYMLLDSEGHLRDHLHAAEGLPVSLIAFAQYDETSRRFAPRQMTPGQAALHLFRYCATPAQVAFPALARLASTTPTVRGRRGEARAAARYLLKRVGSPSH